MTPKRQRFTPKQQRFCEEYLRDLNGTQAAIRAGYGPKAANREASRLLSKVDVRAEIARLQAARTERTRVTADMVVEELRRLAFGDARRLYRPDGSLKSPCEWDAETAAAVSGVETVEAIAADGSGGSGVRTRKVRQWDKKGALELLGRHLGMFRDKVEVSGPGGGPLEVTEVVVSTREQAEAVLAALPAAGRVPG